MIKMCGSCKWMKFGKFCYFNPPTVAVFKKNIKGVQDWTSVYPVVSPTALACSKFEHIHGVLEQ